MEQAPAAFVPSVANWRDSQERLVRARKAKTAMAARLRPARIRNSPRCFARARHRNMAARLRPARHPAIAVRPDSFRCARLRNCPASLTATQRNGKATDRTVPFPFRCDLSPTPRRHAPRLNCRSRPVAPRAAVLALRFAVEESEQVGFALARLAPRFFPQTRLNRSSARGWLSRRSASRCEHKSVLCVIPPHCRIPLAREPSATSLRRLIAYASCVGLRRPGVLNITASCVHTRCFTVTLTAR